MCVCVTDSRYGGTKMILKIQTFGTRQTVFGALISWQCFFGIVKRKVSISYYITRFENVTIC